MSKRLPAVVVSLAILLSAQMVYAQAYAVRLLRKVTPQSIPNATQTKIDFDTVDYDVGGISNITTDKVTIAAAGKYHLRAAWMVPVTAGTRCWVYIFVNGVRNGVDFRPSDAYGNCEVVTEEVLSLNTGDTVEMYVYHESGAAANSYAGGSGDANPVLTVTLIAGAASGGGSSQWTTTSSDIYFSGGKVGIGTTSPAAVLHVSAATPTARITNTDATQYGGLMLFEGSTQKFGLVTIGSSAGAGMLGGPNAVQLWNYANGNMIFGTSATERMRVDAAGNVGIGTTAPQSRLHVAGNVQIDGNIAARYQDVAEWVRVARSLDAGTVVVASGTDLVDASRRSYDTAVLGVVSARPGLVHGEGGEDKVVVAQSGRVRVKVDASYGAIHVGDLLVTSPTPGVAMRSTPISFAGAEIHRPGTLLGKALEPLADGDGEILVLLTLQ